MICRANTVCCAGDPEGCPRQVALFTWDTLMGCGDLEAPLWNSEEAADAAKGSARLKCTLQRELGADGAELPIRCLLRVGSSREK